MACCEKIMNAADVITPCECDEPGFCNRHQCIKHPAWHLLCRRRIEYYQLWEKGRGPGQGKPAFTLGLGDVVAWILSRIGVKPWEGCACDSRKAWLNRIQLWPIWKKR